MLCQGLYECKFNMVACTLSLPALLWCWQGALHDTAHARHDGRSSSDGGNNGSNSGSV